MKKNACVIIPARFNSSRYPGKPLVLLAGKPLIVWVCELSSKAVGNQNVFVATDSTEIKGVVQSNGYQTIMTSQTAPTGTDRIAEALELESLEYDIIVNVQGDEPMVDPQDILRVIDLKSENSDRVINCFSYLTEKESVHSKNIPKVVINEKNDLVYISRSPIPGCKTSELTSKQYKKQVCIYGFSKQDLHLFKKFGKKSEIEICEDIEILRFFELGINILMHECKSESLAVDCPEDVKIVEKELTRN